MQQRKRRLWEQNAPGAQGHLAAQFPAGAASSGQAPQGPQSAASQQQSAPGGARSPTAAERHAVLYPSLSWALQVPSPDPFYTDLTVELVQHVRQTQPSVKDVALRQLVLRVITDTIRNDALPEYSSRLEVLPFGSFVSGLGSVTSDLDLVVTGVQSPGPSGFYEPHERWDVSQYLDKISRSLRSNQCPINITSLNTIRQARIPLIKPQIRLHAQGIARQYGIPPPLTMQDLTSMRSLCLDISLASDSGPKAAQHVAQQCQSYPCLRPLCLVIKAYLQSRSLNDVATGGLSSYGLTYMVLALLQQEPETTGNLGLLLHKFFTYYGIQFDMEREAVCTAQRGCVPRSRVVNGYRNLDRYLVVDPLTNRHVTEGCFKAKDVRHAFKRASDFLTHRLKCRKAARKNGTQAKKTEADKYILDTLMHIPLYGAFDGIESESGSESETSSDSESESSRSQSESESEGSDGQGEGHRRKRQKERSGAATPKGSHRTLTGMAADLNTVTSMATAPRLVMRNGRLEVEHRTTGPDTAPHIGPRSAGNGTGADAGALPVPDTLFAPTAQPWPTDGAGIAGPSTQQRVQQGQKKQLQGGHKRTSSDAGLDLDGSPTYEAENTGGTAAAAHGGKKQQTGPARRIQPTAIGPAPARAAAPAAAAVTAAPAPAAAPARPAGGHPAVASPPAPAAAAAKPTRRFQPVVVSRPAGAAGPTRRVQPVAITAAKASPPGVGGSTGTIAATPGTSGTPGASSGNSGDKKAGSQQQQGTTRPSTSPAGTARPSGPARAPLFLVAKPARSHAAGAGSDQKGKK